MNINIMEFGAVADGVTVNTTAIQNAIDKVAESGGGRVSVPQGTFITGTIRLKSNVEFHLEHGAYLKASANMDDYNPDDEYPENFGSERERWTAKHMFVCVRQKNVAITGTGTVDASAEYFFEEPREAAPSDSYAWMFGCFNVKDPVIKRPGQVVAIVDSEKIKISDVEFINSTCWTVFLHGCRYVDISRVRILNQLYHENTDGIDIDTCENVTVSDCIIKTGDDCITLRCASARLNNGMDTCKNVSVTNCVMECAASAFRIGVGTGKIRNAVISNITVSRAGVVLNFVTSYAGKGEAFIENINVSNITAENAGFACKMMGNDRGCIKDVSISNFRAHMFSSLYIYAEKSEVISGINFSDIHLISKNADYKLGDEERKFRGDYLIYAKKAENVTFNNMVAEIREEFPGKWKGVTRFEDCHNVKINGGNITVN